MGDAEDEECEYAVEDILAERTSDGKKYYLVKWMDYPIYDCTWEPPENFMGNSLEYWEQKKEEYGGDGSERLYRYMQKNVEAFERACEEQDVDESEAAEPALEPVRPRAESPPSACDEPRSLFVREPQRRRSRPLIQSSSSESSSGEEEESLMTQYEKRKSSTTAPRPAVRQSDQIAKTPTIVPASPLANNNSSIAQSSSDNNQRKDSHGRISIVNKPVSKRVWKKGNTAFRTLQRRHAFQKFNARERTPDPAALHFPLDQPAAASNRPTESFEEDRIREDQSRRTLSTPAQRGERWDDDPYGRRDYGRRREREAEETPPMAERIAGSHKAPRICLDWRSGYCPLSDDKCRFWHENIPGMEVSQFDQGVPPKYRDPPLSCYYYMATPQGCNKTADECGYAHENTGWLADQNGGRPKQIDKNQLPLWETNLGAKSKQKPKDQTPPITCWFYMEGPMGCARSAEQCGYAHWNTGLLGRMDQSIVQIPLTQQPRFQPAQLMQHPAGPEIAPLPNTGDSTRQPPWKDPTGKTCYFWFVHGHCSKPADQCKFRHEWKPGDEVAGPRGPRLQKLMKMHEDAGANRANTIPLGSPARDDNTGTSSPLDPVLGNTDPKPVDEAISARGNTKDISDIGQRNSPTAAVKQSLLKAQEIVKRISGPASRPDSAVSPPSLPFVVQSPPSHPPPPRSPPLPQPQPPLAGQLQGVYQSPPAFSPISPPTVSATFLLRGGGSSEGSPAMASAAQSSRSLPQFPDSRASRFISCSTMKSVIEEALKLDFAMLFTNSVDPSVYLDRRALLLFHPTEQVEEMELVRRWLLLHHVEVYSLDVDGSWEYFREKRILSGGSGIIIAPPQFDKYWTIPGFGQVLQGKKVRVWSLGCQAPLDYDAEFVDRDRSKYECEEVFSHGGIIYMTDDVLEKEPAKARELLDLFVAKVNKCRNETDLAAPWDYKDYSSLFWRLAVRPELIQSAFDRVDSLEVETRNPDPNPLTPELASLLVRFADLAELNFIDHMEPGYMPHLTDFKPILSEAADESQDYFDALRHSQADAIEQQVEYWAKKACAMGKCYRQFFVVHTEPRAEWQSRFHNIEEVMTPEKCIELLKEEGEGSRMDFLEWYLEANRLVVQQPEEVEDGDPMDISS